MLCQVHVQEFQTGNFPSKKKGYRGVQIGHNTPQPLFFEGSYKVATKGTRFIS